MKIYNSLTRKVEEFKPLNPSKVGMYTCGPTVYDYQHIGNFRTMVLSDLLHRTLKFIGFEVTTVRNITDIDDKTIKGSKEKGVSLQEYTKKYTKAFFDDLKKLNVLPVSTDTHATEYINEMIDYTKALIEKDMAYVEKDGSVYFDISRHDNYGKLSRIDKRNLKTGTRVLSDEYSKDDAQDFALWKSEKEGEVGFNSPWGKGRPGWHIECSVMSQKNLGDTIDVHVGGVDLLFPHHENEIAQSEAKTGKKFVNYFVHGEHLLVDAKKMSKSLNNFYKISDIEEKGFDPLALRYLYLTAHYRDSLNFTWKSLEAAQVALTKLREHIRTFHGSQKGDRTVLSEEKLKKVDDFRDKFTKAIENDLATPQAIAVVWETVKSNIPDTDKYDLLLTFDEVLGLRLRQVSDSSFQIPEEISRLAKERESLRKAGKFEEADETRQELEEKGFTVSDTASGTIVRKALAAQND